MKLLKSRIGRFAELNQGYNPGVMGIAVRH